MKAKRSDLADNILQDETLSRQILDAILSAKDPNIKVDVPYNGDNYVITEMK